MMQYIYIDFCATKLRSKTPVAVPLSYSKCRMLKVTGYFINAETQLRHTIIFITDKMLERQGSAFLNSINEVVKRRLDIEAGVNQ